MRGRARRHARATRAKEIQKNFKRPLDKKQILCYNKDVRKREGKLLKTRKGYTMTKEIMNTIYTTLNTVDFENKPAVMEALEKELHRNDRVKAEKIALYEQAKDAVLEVLRTASGPATVAEIFEACESQLPIGFSKSKVQYGLTHYWTEEVEKIEGKVNSYRMKEGA